jgi:DNA-binding CsgD family transcriptional regulator
LLSIFPAVPPVHILTRGAIILKKAKRFQQLFGNREAKQEKAPPAAEALVFCEKSTGAPRFKVEMNGDAEAAFSRAASLLALGCMVRGDSPADYAVLVPAESATIERIKKHADELLHLGRSLSCSVNLSPREGEVLKELLHHRLNKEIADRLSISVRTVKFHVSSLLAKFGVGSRWDLIQKAQPMLNSAQLAGGFAVPSSPAESAAPQHPAQPLPKYRKPRRDSQDSEEHVVPFRRLRPA